MSLKLEHYGRGNLEEIVKEILSILHKDGHIDSWEYHAGDFKYLVDSLIINLNTNDKEIIVGKKL